MGELWNTWDWLVAAEEEQKRLYAREYPDAMLRAIYVCGYSESKREPHPAAADLAKIFFEMNEQRMPATAHFLKERLGFEVPRRTSPPENATENNMYSGSLNPMTAVSRGRHIGKRTAE